MGKVTTRLNRDERDRILSQVTRAFDWLRYDLHFPLNTHNQPKETVFEEIGKVTAAEVAEMLQLMQVHMNISPSAHFTIGIPESPGKADEELYYGVTRSNYNRVARRDWVWMKTVPLISPQTNTIKFRLDSPKGPALQKWVCAFIALRKRTRHAKMIIEEVLKAATTVGQLVRMWPGVATYLDSDQVSKAMRQRARSRLPEDWDHVQFVPVAEKLEKMIARSLVIELAHGKDNPPPWDIR